MPMLWAEFCVRKHGQSGGEITKLYAEKACVTGRCTESQTLSGLPDSTFEFSHTSETNDDDNGKTR